MRNFKESYRMYGDGGLALLASSSETLFRFTVLKLKIWIKSHSLLEFRAEAVLRAVLQRSPKSLGWQELKSIFRFSKDFGSSVITLFESSLFAF